MKNIESSRLRILITNKCNISCAYCHNEGQLGRDNFITLDTLRDIMLMLRKSNRVFDSVTISGGEPLLHKELIYIVEMLTEISSNISLVTNGVLLSPKLLLNLKEAGVTYIKVGVDSIQRDDCNGGKGITVAFLQNIELIKELFPNSAINTVFDPNNPHVIKDMLHFVSEHRLRLKVLELIPSNPIDSHLNNWIADIKLLLDGYLDFLYYNKETAKYYCETINNRTQVVLLENFCKYKMCRNLWLKVDSFGKAIPCFSHQCNLDVLHNIHLNCL